VKNEEEAEEMEREFQAAVAHACVQQADLTAHLKVTNTTIKQQAHTLE
jgi:hypothetical protein